MTKIIQIEVAVNEDDLVDAIVDAIDREESGEDLDYESIEAQIREDFQSAMIQTRFEYDTETMEVLSINE